MKDGFRRFCPILRTVIVTCSLSPLQPQWMPPHPIRCIIYHDLHKYAGGSFDSIVHVPPASVNINTIEEKSLYLTPDPLNDAWLFYSFHFFKCPTQKIYAGYFAKYKKNLKNSRQFSFFNYVYNILNENNYTGTKWPFS